MFSPRSAAPLSFGGAAAAAAASSSSQNRRSSSRQSLLPTSHKRKKRQQQQTPLLELRSALDRIDALTLHARETYEAEVGGGTLNSTTTNTSSNGDGGSAASASSGRGIGRLAGMRQGSRRFGFGGGSRRSVKADAGNNDDDDDDGVDAKDKSDSTKKEEEKEEDDDVLVSTEEDERAIISQFLAEEERSKASPPSLPDEGERGQQAQKELSKQPKNVRFVPFHQDDEAELIELLRRTAELVVQGERAASAALSRAEKAGSSNNRDDEDDDADNDDNGDADDDDVEKEESDDENSAIMAEYDAHQAVFECFCEREGLQTMVNITTGTAFKVASVSGGATAELASAESSDSATNGNSSPAKAVAANDGDNDTETDDSTVLLPPLSIATQAVQSVSILLQNVNRVTSLYFLLSNNRVNDLINLPLDRYQMAEGEAKRSASGIDPAGRTPSRHHLHNQNSSLGRDASAEMAELTTHFVSFLKSLAMRMNEETLQFFLSYPENGIGSKKVAGSGSSLNEFADQVEDKLAVDTIRVDADEEDRTNNGPTAPAADGGASIRVRPQDVKFPLYARALQFCSQEQDSFVRVTAMNICLNTIRVATITGENDTSSGREEDDDGGKAPAIKSPDGGSLHKSAALPFRERMAIARHVCAPDRVECLVSPIFIKLGRLCGPIGESIRAFEELDVQQRECVEKLHSLQSESDSCDNKGDTTVDEILEELEQFESRRQRLRDTFLDRSADLQDELLLLEDLLQVGLTSVNEQTIEMMLAAFIYPLLMQPLRLFMQRHHPKAPDFGNGSKAASVSDSEEDSGGSPRKIQHPFSTESIINSLERSGLLDEPSDAGGERPSAGDARGGDTLSPSVNLDASFAVTSTTSDPDSAPAKTALFLASAVLHTITNKPLLHMLSTALFHPLAPVAEGGLIVKAKPEVSVIDSRGLVHIRADTDSTIYYPFGQSDTNVDGVDTVGVDDDTDLSCVFVLAPALSSVFRSTVDSSYSAPETRENPYRRAMLACLGGTDHMSTLQALAFFTVDAAFSTIENTYTNGIILGAGVASPTNSLGSCAVETISNLCAGVMTATQFSHGIWNLELNPFATNALLAAAVGDEKAHQSTASKLVQHRVRQAMSYLTQLPSHIDNSMPSALNECAESKASDPSNEICLDVILDQMFFDSHLAKQRSIVESLARGTTSASRGCEQHGPCYVPITKQSSLDDVCAHVCKKPSDLLVAGDVLAPIQYGANSALACIKLDTFSRFFSGSMPADAKELKTLYGRLVTSSINENKIGEDGGDNDEASYDGCSGASQCIFAPLEGQLASVLLDEEDNGDAESSSRDDSRRPKPGSLVGLIGRAAFPCVCEVSPDAASLFTDKGSCVIAEGIKWQSLYLVILGKYMILAEPERSGSGGNGRVVSSCRLTCLRAEKDDPPTEESQSPARRLLLSYASSDRIHPVLFTPEDVPFRATRNTVRLTRSRMDVWFEDEKAAGHAFKVLSARITKARSRRGHRLSDVLIKEGSSSDLFMR